MKENSIEEYKNSNFSIEAKFESMIKMAKEIISQNKEGVGDCSIETALAYDVAAYLSDYKRVLKENEELKEEKINNYKMMVLAQNEALGYMQGYEDGKNSRTSAIASIVENQQYYIIRKQIEKYKENIKKLQTENEKLNKLHIQDNKHLDFIIKNSISIQKVKDKMEKDLKTNEHTILGGRRNGKTLEYGKRLGRIEMCQELLEGRK